MKYLLLIFSIIFLFHFASGQNPESTNVQFYELMKARNPGTSDDIIGSPYLFKEWGEIRIFLKDSSNYKLPNSNINIYTPSIDVVHNQLLKEIPLQFIDKVQIKNNGTEKFFRPAVNYIKEGLKDKGFAEVHDLKNYTVLTHHFITIQKPDPQAQILGTEKRTKYIHTTKLYILQKKNLYPIRGKKDLKEVLKGKFPKAEEIINTLNLDVDKTEDLVTLLEKLES